MWFKVDDQLAFHPKVMAAGNEAIGLWVRAGAWCSAYLTDGRIPKAVAHGMASDMANAIALANGLLMAKLWLDDGDHYVFHDWDKFQPSASKVLARREEISEKRKLAGQKGARARWSKTDDGKSDGKCHSKSHSKTMAPGWQTDGPVPVPVPPTSKEVERPRPDVQAICETMSEALDANEVRYTVTKAWRDAARLMLDRDGRPLEEIRDVIRFATSDPFWMGNIHSIPKLRKQYDKLRLQMRRPAGRVAPADRWAAAFDELDAQEHPSPQIEPRRTA